MGTPKSSRTEDKFPGAIGGSCRDQNDSFLAFKKNYSFACSWDASSYWAALSSIGVRAFALSYCIFFCRVWWLSLGGLIFSEGRRWGNGSKGDRRWEGRSRIGINCKVFLIEGFLRIASCT